MNGSVATVEPNGEKLEIVRPTEPGDSRPPAAPAGGARFTYASGAQPLAGFTIKRGVGQGGFGEVYYAMSDGGKEVALKLIRRSMDVELRGIRHCLNLKHPNLLSIFDIRQDAHGDNWVVMEYVAGQCLEEAVAANPQGMPIDQVLAWFRGIAGGVACLHDHGIVHRDLKPANIFCDEGTVKIGDYGLSKFISCSRRSGHTESVGTVHYMAPEIANGRYGKEIDIYALGVILYEMLTGRVPFEGESVGEVLMKHLTTPPDVSMLREPFRSVVARALEKDPAKRFGSVAEMLEALPRPAQADVQLGPIPVAAGRGGTAPTTPGAPHAAVPAVPVGPSINEEPIFRACRNFCCRIRDGWNESGLNTPTKILLFVLGSMAILFFAPGLLSLAIVLAVLYACYWTVRSIVLLVCGPPAFPAAPPPTIAPRPAPAPRAGSPFVADAALRPSIRPQDVRRSRWRRPRETPAEAFVLKSARERAAELFGSLLASALVTLTMTVVMLLVPPVLSRAFHYNLAVEPSIELGAWLALVGIAGAWSVLVPSKFWEGSRGDPMVRRFILMVTGLGVGVFASFVPTMLYAASSENVVGPDGQPTLMAFMAVFGAMFLVIRWWRQSDPLRGTRLSLWMTIGTVVLAWLICELLRFPAPSLMMAAAVMSVAIQLASPWVHPRLRRAEQLRR